MSYSNELDMLKDLLNFGYGETLHRKIDALDENDYHKIRNALPILIARTQDLKEEIDEHERDRITDFDAMIRSPKKRFQEIDIEILEALDNSDYIYPYKSIQNIIAEAGHEKPSRNVLSKRMHRLMRLGLIKYVKGLFDEDGMPAGSGFCINQRRASIASSVVQSYRATESQESLL